MSFPPSCNTGGKSPLKPDQGRSRTKIDHLAYTVRASYVTAMQIVEEALAEAGGFSIAQAKGGRHGYHHRSDVLVDGAKCGELLWGGEQQRGTVHTQLSGVGCQLAASHLAAVARKVEEAEGTLTRVDIAADFFDGSVTLKGVQEAHKAGRFTRGGRPPKLRGNLTLDGSQRGSTLYIGARENDVYGRFYEKGREVLGEQVCSILSEPTDLITLEVDGAEVDPFKWVRGEVELKPRKRELPFDIVERRDHYYAGCYPYLAELLPNATPELILTPQRQGQLNLDLALANIQRQYGSTLYTALVAYGGDICAVWDKIVGDKLNAELVQSGALIGR